MYLMAKSYRSNPQSARDPIYRKPAKLSAKRRADRDRSGYKYPKGSIYQPDATGRLVFVRHVA